MPSSAGPRRGTFYFILFLAAVVGSALLLARRPPEAPEPIPTVIAATTPAHRAFSAQVESADTSPVQFTAVARLADGRTVPVALDTDTPINNVLSVAVAATSPTRQPVTCRIFVDGQLAELQAEEAGRPVLCLWVVTL